MYNMNLIGPKIHRFQRFDLWFHLQDRQKHKLKSIEQDYSSNNLHSKNQFINMSPHVANIWTKYFLSGLCLFIYLFLLNDTRTHISNINDSV